MKKRIITIGDVHGCLEETKRLLNVLNYDETKDRLIFLGDLVDRGPESAACVKYIRKLGVECIMGNHDQKLVRYHKHELKIRKDSTYTNPIKYSDKQKEQYRLLADDDLEWLGSIPNYILLKEINTILLHAGVQGGKHPLKQNKNAYVHCRYVNKSNGKMLKLGKNYEQPENSEFWTEQYLFPYDIIYGHQVVSLDNIKIQTNINGGTTYGIDTGACYGGKLTALVFEDDGTKTAVQVNSKYKSKDFMLVDRSM